MGFTLVAEDLRTGHVIIEDDTDGGRGVLLLCGPPDAPGPAIAISPGPETPSFPWPTKLRESFGIDQWQEPFELVIDVSGIPWGPVMFEADKFLRRVLAAVDQGHRRTSCIHVSSR